LILVVVDAVDSGRPDADKLFQLAIDIVGLGVGIFPRYRCFLLVVFTR
jgi:hypothetical protein